MAYRLAFIVFIILSGSASLGQETEYGSSVAARLMDAATTPTAVIRVTTTTLTSGDCTDPGSAIPPSRVMTVDIGITNTGTTGTTDLVAELQPAYDIVPVIGTQHYGAVATTSSAVRTFTFFTTPNRVCGRPLYGDIVFSDSGTTLSTRGITIVNGTSFDIRAVGSSLLSESCFPFNGVMDHGEQVTVNLALKNLGQLPTTNVVAILQATGGVDPITTSAEYGVIAGGGTDSVARPFTFNVSQTCGTSATITLRLTDGIEDMGTVTYEMPVGIQYVDPLAGLAGTFVQSTSISIPSSGAGTPYPSTITVPSSGLVNKVTVKLNNVNHSYPDDIDVLLVGPAGQKVMLMSDVGGGTDLLGVNLTIADAAASALPDSAQIVSGAYRPTNIGTGDGMPAPAPTEPYSTTLAAFNGTNGGGTWQLFVRDDVGGDSGFIGSWELTLTGSAPPVYICCGDGQNTPPRVTVPPVQTTSRDVTTSIPAISIADDDLGSGDIQTSLTVSNGTLSLGTKTGLTFLAGDGSNDSLMAFRGSLASTNAALASLSFTPQWRCLGPALLTCLANDLGHTGTGGSRYGLGQVPLSIIPGPFAENGTTLTLEGCAPANGAVDSLETVTVDVGIRNTTATTTGNITATALAADGVTPDTASQDLGIMSLGETVVRPFTFAASNPCGTTIGLSLRLTDSTHDYGVVQYVYALGAPYIDPILGTSFRQTNAITAPSSGYSYTPATPYPSTITVPANILVNGLKVRLNNVSHTDSRVLDILLVGPRGQNVMLMSDCGGGYEFAAVNLTFDDAAASAVPRSGHLVSGTYRPTNVGTGDAMQTPAPAEPYSTALSVFNGTDAVGTWQLFVQNAGYESGVIGSWELILGTGSTDYICCGGAQNKPPGIQAPTTQTVAELIDVPLPGISISDPDAGSADILTSLSANHGLLTLGSTAGLTFEQGHGSADRVVAFRGSVAAVNAALSSLSIRSDYGFYRDSTLMVFVDDLGHTGTGGTRRALECIGLDNGHVNTAPVLTLPGAQLTAEDVALTVHGIGVSDPDALDDPMRTSLSCSHGGLTIPRYSPSRNFSFSANAADTSAALSAMIYTPAAHYNGPDTIVIQVNDLGHNGTGGALVTSGSIPLIITPAQDAPFAGLAGGALRFDLTDYCEVPDTDDSLDMKAGDSITLEAWVRADEFQYGSILSKGATHQNYRLGITPDRRLYLGYHNTSGYFAMLYSTPIITARIWTHVALCYTFSSSNSNPEAYVDGTTTALNWSYTYHPTILEPKVSNDPLKIGPYHVGAIDEVRIWRRRLSADEIRRKRNERIPAHEPGLVACWRFDETTGTTFADSTSASHQGTFVVGSPHWIESGADIYRVSAQQQLDLVLALNGVDVDGDPFDAIVSSPPTTGTLYQYETGARGPQISEPGTTVTDALHRVIFSPGDLEATSPLTSLHYYLDDHTDISAETTVVINLLPANATPWFEPIALQDPTPTLNTSPNAYTNDSTVTVMLSGGLPFYAADFLDLSEDPSFPSAYTVPYTGQSSEPYALSPGDGLKTVHARLRTASLTSNVTSSSITLDTTPPAVTLASTASDPTGSPAVPVTATFDENVHGFDAADIAADNATVANFSGSGAAYSFNLNAAAPGNVSASILAGACADDAGNSNTSANLSRTVIAADVGITKTGTPNPAGLFSVLTYTVVATNHGPDTATSVTLVDTLSSNTEYLTSSATQGTCAVTSDALVCDLGSLAADHAATATIQVRTMTSGTVANVATATANEWDLVPSNNSVTEYTNVQPYIVWDDDTFATDNEEPPGSSSGWNRIGVTHTDPSLNTSDYDTTNGAYRVRIFSSATRFHITGWANNRLEWLPYSAIGSARYVRAKFYMYAAPHDGSSFTDLRQLPNFEMRLASRFAVTANLQVYHHNQLDEGNNVFFHELRPSTDPASPSVYRLDFDPIDVPFLSTSTTGEGILTGFDVFTLDAHDNGYIGITERVIGTYAASLIDDSAALQTKIYAATATDAGNLRIYNPATDFRAFNYVPPPPGSPAGTHSTTEITGPLGSYAETGAGITMDTTAVSSSRIGFMERSFYAGASDGTSAYEDRIRVEPGKQYKVRWHITSTQTTTQQSWLWLLHRSVKYAYQQSLQLAGGWSSDSVETQAVIRQSVPGVGCLNPDQQTPGESGGWYTILYNTPLCPEIRPEFAAGTPMSARMPNIMSQPAPGVNADSLRDVKVGAQIYDSISQGFGAGTEGANFTIDRIEVRVYDLVED